MNMGLELTAQHLRQIGIDGSISKAHVDGFRHFLANKEHYTDGTVRRCYTDSALRALLPLEEGAEPASEADRGQLLKEWKAYQDYSAFKREKVRYGFTRATPTDSDEKDLGKALLVLSHGAHSEFDHNEVFQRGLWALNSSHIGIEDFSQKMRPSNSDDPTLHDVVALFQMLDSHPHEQRLLSNVILKRVCGLSGGTTAGKTPHWFDLLKLLNTLYREAAPGNKEFIKQYVKDYLTAGKFTVKWDNYYTFSVSLPVMERREYQKYFAQAQDDCFLRVAVADLMPVVIECLSDKIAEEFAPAKIRDIALEHHKKYPAPSETEAVTEGYRQSVEFLSREAGQMAKLSHVQALTKEENEYLMKVRDAGIDLMCAYVDRSGILDVDEGKRMEAIKVLFAPLKTLLRDENWGFLRAFYLGILDRLKQSPEDKSLQALAQFVGPKLDAKEAKLRAGRSAVEILMDNDRAEDDTEPHAFPDEDEALPVEEIPV